MKGGNKAYQHIGGKLSGPDEKAGHLLRNGPTFPPPSYVRHVKILIVGAGVSGLSAGRWLKKQTEEDFLVLELEAHAGGNAGYRSNPVSAYPLGAHYITIANNEDVDLIDFLKENGIITGFQDGLPVYNEFDLCFDPEERLLINGQWQEGLVPQFGISKEDKLQIDRFFVLINSLKEQRGRDGKYAFYIPLDLSSTDPLYRKLDELSFEAYMKQQGFSSTYLFWYLDYCCKDDFSRPAKDISAWAGLNYFAGHKGRAANAEPGSVLTWPEGNGRLLDMLRKDLEAHVKTSSMVYAVTPLEEGGLKVSVFDLKENKSYTIYAEKVIMASPQFVNRRLLKDYVASLPAYAPWMVANITLSDLPANRGTSLCWDNVAYGTASVGYVYAGHQHVDRSAKGKVITFYLPLCDREPRISRLAAYSRNHAQWLDIIVPELEYMHPGITELIESVEIWVWGHGMVVPSPGYLFGSEKMVARKPLNNKIFFAHTDLSGISLFEEGFYQGIRAAKEVLTQ